MRIMRTEVVMAMLTMAVMQAIKRRVRATVVATIMTIFLLAEAQGSILVTADQSYTPTSGIGGGPFIFGRQFGQSFTPTLSSLDVVEVLTYDNQPTNGIGAVLRAIIHQGQNLDGAILATSQNLSLADGFGYNSNIFLAGAVTHFDFASSVTLTPGLLYTIEINQVSGDTQWVMVNGNTDAVYTRGQGLIDDTKTLGYDFWFREGPTVAAVPEPATLVIWSLGALGCAVAGYRRRKVA